MNREDQEIEKIHERRVALVNAVSEIEGQRRAAELKLQELESKRGELVLAVAMGETPVSELLAMRREMQELRDVIADAGAIPEIARRRERRLGGEEQKLSAKRLRRQEYIALRQKLTDNPALANEPGITVPMRELCAFLDGDTTDADTAIATAKRTRAA